jgi:proteasome lid subunit RPN8/RPN11
MWKDPYKYIVEIYRDDNSPIGQASIAPDWEPAREAVRFQAIRRARLPLSVGNKEAVIEPLWHSTAKEPYLRGFRVSFSHQYGEVADDFPTAYFHDLAQLAGTRFVEKGLLEVGDHFRYLVAAYARDEEPAQTNRLSITTEEIAQALRLKESSLDVYQRAAEPCGETAADEMPVFIPQQVLDEVADLTREAVERETGGILIGHLRRDESVPEVFVEVTTQLAARHTVSELTKLTFTAETWTECRAALDLRRKDEIFLGWWHSHPVRAWQCKHCPLERQRVCSLARDYFSEHDRALQRTVFPRAYSVALVANDVAFGGVNFSMFGWRSGGIEARGFHVLGANGTAIGPLVKNTIGEPCHVNERE